MATFDEELQILLDRHPEVAEVRVKYKKAGTVFKPREVRNFPLNTNGGNSNIIQTTEALTVAEMIKKGEL